MWHHVAARSIGTSHAATGAPCQDRETFRTIDDADGGEAAIGIVCDGAGSAKYSEEGAEIVSTSLRTKVSNFVAASGASKIETEMLRNWIVEIRDLIGAQADAQGSDSRDYACTLVFAIASDTQTILGQIGDGAVIVKNEESLIVPIWPENGEYANQTFFVTQEDSHHRLKLAKLGAVTDFIVISDGLQRLALREADRAPHSGFISPLIDAVRTNYDAAPLSVTQFLASPRVNERTDDDKAIVIACRIA